MTKNQKLAEAHRLIAFAMGVPLMSVDSEQRFTAIARKASGESERQS